MKFVFFQNVLSIHQSAFIKALSTRHCVTLAVAEPLSRSRKKEGWEVPDMGQASIVVSPSDGQIEAILEEKDAHYVFSGIDAFPFVYTAFRKAVKNGYEVSVLVEPYDWRGIKGNLRRWKYRLLFAKYGRYIKYLFVTGLKGAECYINASFPKGRIRQWGYFTERQNVNIRRQVEYCLSSSIDNVEVSTVTSSVQKVKIIFVGRLDDNKNVMSVIRMLPEMADCIEVFTIVGKGPLADYLQSHDIPKVNYMGGLPNRLTRTAIAEHDILILPSKYDGWGAVVNEALSVGTRVLCSCNCGAAVLLDGKMRGEAFDLRNMKEVVMKWVEKGSLSEKERTLIQDWADKNISGTVAAEYFANVFSCKGSVRAPWIGL